MKNDYINPIYITYDVNLRNKCTECGIRYLVIGLNPTTMKTFWVYNRLDQNFIKVLKEWIPN